MCFFADLAVSTHFWLRSARRARLRRRARACASLLCAPLWRGEPFSVASPLLAPLAGLSLAGDLAPFSSFALFFGLFSRIWYLLKGIFTNVFTLEHCHNAGRWALWQVRKTRWGLGYTFFGEGGFSSNNRIPRVIYSFAAEFCPF